MANYRQIHVQIWKDQWFLDLPADFKLLFVYLFSNERTSVAGIYDLALRVIEFETGLSLDTIAAGLDEFARAGKVYYEDGLVWVVNLRRYNATNSIKVRTRIQQDLLALPNCSLLRRYLDHEGYPMEGDTREMYLKEPESPPTEVQNSPKEYGIQNEEIPYPVGESDHEHDHDHEHEHDHVPAPAQRRKTPGDREQHPAVAIYQEEAGQSMDDNLKRDIVDAVGVIPGNLILWRDVVHGWMLTGYGKRNIGGMLDFYRRGEIPTTRPATGPPSDDGDRPPKPPREVRGLNELPDWLGGKAEDNA